MKDTHDCLLYSNWSVSRHIVRHEHYDGRIERVPEYHLMPERTFWGERSACDWTQYGFVGAAILAFLLCWFFVLFRPYKEAFAARWATAWILIEWNWWMQTVNVSNASGPADSGPVPESGYMLRDRGGDTGARCG